MRALAFGDPHIAATGKRLDYSAFSPSHIDLFITVGDVVDDVDQSYIERGREFFALLNGFDVPVVTIPGNHDTLHHHETLIERYENVVNAHKHVITGTDFPQLDTPALETVSIVGWGCEEFDITPEIVYPEYPALDPLSDDCRYTGHDAIHRVAAEIEDATTRFIHEDASPGELAADLEIPEDQQARFGEELVAVVDNYAEIAALLTGTSNPTILLTHAPPFNTDADFHHDASIPYHWGVIGLKQALVEYRPVAAISGHTHTGGYDMLEIPEPTVHVLNLEYRTVYDIQLDLLARQISYTPY